MTLIGLSDLILIGINFFWIYYFIGDAEALAAIRISSSIIVLIEAVLMGVTGALLIYMGQSIGAKQMDKVKSAISATFSFSIYSGAFVMIIGLLCLPVLKGIFGANDVTNDYLDSYLFVYFLGYIVMALNNLLLMLPRYFRKLGIIYKALGVTMVVNIIATPLCMYIFQMQGYNMVAGAAAGIIVSNICCMVYLVYSIFFKDSLEISLSKEHISYKLDLDILKTNKGFIGSQVLSALSFNISMFLYTFILTYYPQESFNVYAVGTYAYAIFGLFAQNFTASLIPLVSNKVGAGEYDGVKDLAKKIGFSVLGYGLVIAVIFFFSRYQLAEVLATNESMIPLFVDFFTYYTLPWVLNMVSFVFIFVVAGSGDGKGGMILTIVNMYVLVIIPLAIVPHLFANLSTGVFVTLGFINVLTFIFSLGYYISGRWEKASLIKRASAEAHAG
nr:MATE family efflux transporter [Priestia taiwanensis]